MLNRLLHVKHGLTHFRWTFITNVFGRALKKHTSRPLFYRADASYLSSYIIRRKEARGCSNSMWIDSGTRILHADVHGSGKTDVKYYGKRVRPRILSRELNSCTLASGLKARVTEELGHAKTITSETKTNTEYYIII